MLVIDEGLRVNQILMIHSEGNTNICTNFKPIHLIIIEVLQSGFKWWTTKQTNQMLAWSMIP